MLQVSVNGGVVLDHPSATTATSTTRVLNLNATYRFRATCHRQGRQRRLVCLRPDLQGRPRAEQQLDGPLHGFLEDELDLQRTRREPRLHEHRRRDRRPTRDRLRNVAWIATRTSTSGSAQIWIDGVLAPTINLRSSSTGYKKLVYHRDFTTLATHTIQIRSTRWRPRLLRRPDRPVADPAAGGCSAFALCYTAAAVSGRP